LEKERLETCLDILKRAEDLGVKIHLPSDSMVANAFDNNADCFIAPSNEIPEGYMALDIGTDAIREFSEIIKQSKTILWNGPMGVFEMSNFSGGTQKVAEVIAEATQNEGAFSLIGGGDSAAAIKKFNLEQSVSYVSTGGGALLEYFEGKALPGIEAITK
jgi:phosphoglycerate kinase